MKINKAFRAYNLGKDLKAAFDITRKEWIHLEIMLYIMFNFDIP